MNGSIIPGTSIAVDFWQAQKHPGIRLFFLTHLHGDHIVGLTDSWRRPIHCTPLTAQLLVERYGINKSLLRPLEIGRTHIIGYCPTECIQNHGCYVTTDNDGREIRKRNWCTSISVSVIDANHCPGAAMFLFEGSFGEILHTGDFRYSPEMLSEGSILCQHIGSIDLVYLDNTYCSTKCCFPTREEAVEEIVDIVLKHPQHDIVFALRNLGKEELLAKVASRVQEWINVPPRLYAVLSAMDVPNYFQTGRPDLRLRVEQFHKVSSAFVRDLNSKKPTIVILPTALYQGIGGTPYANQPQVFVVPYSDHSSFPELVKFVAGLKPARVITIQYAMSPCATHTRDCKCNCKENHSAKRPPTHSKWSTSSGDSQEGYETCPDTLSSNEKTLSEKERTLLAAKEIIQPKDQRETEELGERKEAVSFDDSDVLILDLSDSAEDTLVGSGEETIDGKCEARGVSHDDSDVLILDLSDSAEDTVVSSGEETVNGKCETRGVGRDGNSTSGDQRVQIELCTDDSGSPDNLADRPDVTVPFEFEDRSQNWECRNSVADSETRVTRKSHSHVKPVTKTLVTASSRSHSKVMEKTQVTVTSPTSVNPVTEETPVVGESPPSEVSPVSVCRPTISAGRSDANPENVLTTVSSVCSRSRSDPLAFYLAFRSRYGRTMSTAQRRKRILQTYHEVFGTKRTGV